MTKKKENDLIWLNCIEFGNKINLKINSRNLMNALHPRLSPNDDCTQKKGSNQKQNKTNTIGTSSEHSFNFNPRSACPSLVPHFHLHLTSSIYFSRLSISLWSARLFDIKQTSCLVYIIMFFYLALIWNNVINFWIINLMPNMQNAKWNLVIVFFSLYLF